MTGMRLKDISEELRNIGFGMLVTRSYNGLLSGSPVKHESRVQYTGESYFFTTEGTSTAQDLLHDHSALISFQSQGAGSLPYPIFISIEGQAKLIGDQSLVAEHWTDELEEWFAMGAKTPGLLLIKVKADRVRYWRGPESGDVMLEEI